MVLGSTTNKDAQSNLGSRVLGSGCRFSGSVSSFLMDRQKESKHCLANLPQP